MNKKVSNLAAALIIIAVTSAALSLFWIQRDAQEDFIAVSQTIIYREIPKDSILTPVSSQKEEISSHLSLFESKEKEQVGGMNKYSNIVGNFAAGAFGWYVPDWLVENWIMKKIEGDPDNQGMIFTPKEAITDGLISDITMYVATSTETFNAETLFENQKRSGVVASEVVLNEHAEGMLTITMETNTMIYHVQVQDREWMTDIYYINGLGKTLSISFRSDKKNFPAYSAKIRDLVEGIGELKVPQG